MSGKEPDSRANPDLTQYQRIAGTLLAPSGVPFGQVVLIATHQRSRASSHRWFRPRWAAAEDVVAFYGWTFDGAYENSVVSGDGLKTSIALWNRGQVEFGGKLADVQWLGEDESRVVAAELERRIGPLG